VGTHDGVAIDGENVISAANRNFALRKVPQATAPVISAHTDEFGL
jgi:homoaconitase/3-isopropylmalate dehydratase large subunit